MSALKRRGIRKNRHRDYDAHSTAEWSRAGDSDSFKSSLID